jgi:hypothetical protein
MKLGSTVSVNGPIDPAVGIGSRPVRFAHSVPQDEDGEPMAEARDDKAPCDDACAVVASTPSFSLERRLAAAVGSPGGRQSHEAHNSAVEQTAARIRSLAAAHRERWATSRRVAPAVSEEIHD